MTNRHLLVEVFVLICLIIVFGGAAYQRNIVWKDDLSLWSDVVKKSPRKDRPYNNLGQAYLGNREFYQAIPFLKESLRFNPYFSYAHFNLDEIVKSPKMPFPVIPAKAGIQ